MTWLLFVAAQVTYAQSLVIGEVQDAFLKVPLMGVRISLLLASDSTIVMDSIPLREIKRNDGTVGRAQFGFQPERKTCKYLLRGTLEGYEDAWQTLNIEEKEEGFMMMDEPLKLRRILQKNLDEVMVTATKVKMYYKGDTLVYNADAFKLPEGSMLDDLIRQMPGVTMNDAGEIFVNGRKVDELLLGSRTFMKGNQKVLLQNLPYFTVKDIKVYDRQTEMSKAAGRDVEPRQYVMDVGLKKEFSVGLIGNAEGAAGTEQRWLARTFLLGFSNRWRYSITANANNVNETRHIGADNHWTPEQMPQSLVTTRNVAANFNFYESERSLESDLKLELTSDKKYSEMHRSEEQFVANRRPTSLWDNIGQNKSWGFKLTHDFSFTKPFYLNSYTFFTLNKGKGWNRAEMNQWEDQMAVVRQQNDDINEQRLWRLMHFTHIALFKEKRYTNYNLFFHHSNNKRWQSTRYDTWQAATQTNQLQFNAYDNYNRSTEVKVDGRWHFDKVAWNKYDLRFSASVDYKNQRAHDYLYHPDTLLLASQLDMMTATTDPKNSYTSHQHNWENNIGFIFAHSTNQGIFGYDRWRVGVDVPLYHHQLHYQRGQLDTLARRSWVYVTPQAQYRYMWPENKQDIQIAAKYQCSPADLLSTLDYRDDAQPLVVKRGNPQLKGRALLTVDLDFRNRIFKDRLRYLVHLNYTYNHRDVAQSVVYEPLTGVYTYQPINIHGAYQWSSKLDVSADLDKKKQWEYAMEADASYTHSLDYTMLAGQTQSQLNAVNTLLLHDRSYLKFSKGALNLRATVDVRWRRSKGQMVDFETLSATDYQYGLSASYTLPWLKTTVTADGTMYSRRGYGSDALNTDDFVLNGSLMQTLWKGKLIARVEAFDLLHQLRPTQYEVNAQGRTEVMYRSLPHYVMLHLIYHFNKNPKKK